MSSVVGDNAPQVDGWTLPTRTFCARLLGEDRCDCATCQVDQHMPLADLGDN